MEPSEQGPRPADGHVNGPAAKPLRAVAFAHAALAPTPDAALESPEAPTRSRAGHGIVAALLALSLLVGYWGGWSHGRNGAFGTGGDRVETPVTAPAAPPPPTTPAAPVAALPLPPVTVTTLGFETGLPDASTGHAPTLIGPWQADGGRVVLTDAAPPIDDARPRRVSVGPSLLVPTPMPTSVASVVLTAPTPLSGLVVRYVDPDNYWAVVVDPGLDHVSLVEVREGEQTARGYVDVAVVAGTRIGVAVAGDVIGITVDGVPKVMNTFYGPRAGLSTAGIAGTQVGLLAGDGTPAFDDLSFG